MRSARQSEASRLNGAKSHGPKTPQGRAISSINAITHGITAQTLTLNNENKDLLVEMLTSYFDLFDPVYRLSPPVGAPPLKGRQPHEGRSNFPKRTRAARHKSCGNSNSRSGDFHRTQGT